MPRTPQARRNHRRDAGSDAPAPADRVPEGVVNRRMQFCRTIQAQGLQPNELIVECDHCNQFFAYCCPCAAKARQNGTDQTEELVPCHHYPIIFVDGACSHNGRGDAVAGIGGTFGALSSHEFSLPVDGRLDPLGPRTSQRAELLAAMQGIETLRSEYYDTGGESVGAESPEKREWVIVSDSEYVVKGLTDWIFEWKARGWRNASNETPANLDLFQTLDNLINDLETENIYVGFWWVPRQYNEIADYLAKDAVQNARSVR